MDVASSIQAAAEKIMITLTSALYREYQIDNLCMAGGVALNCVANGKILKQSGFKHIWIQPAAGDAGGALGAAYAVYYGYSGDARKEIEMGDKMQNSLLGPSFTSDEIRKCLIENGINFEELSTENLNNKIAACLADGKVVGYFRGRMEFGPRALGARSILADPRNADMQSILNQKIKFRESFRPFAAASLEEHAAEYFELVAKSPYMLLVTSVRPKHRIFSQENKAVLKGFDRLKDSKSVITAVTHIDYTARLQTVNSKQNPGFYNLLQAFYKLTSCSCLVNTSFNRMDEPIVNTPQEALTCFIQTGMDILVLEGFMLRK
jgi:carbamoyltransferase